MINIATVLNRLQKLIKDNPVDELNGNVPVGVSILMSGSVAVRHTNTHVEIFPTMGKAAQYIHNRLDEIERM